MHRLFVPWVLCVLLAAGTRAHDRDGLWDDCAELEPLSQTEFDQHAAGIRGELQAGPDFLEPLGLFQYDDAKTVGGQRERSRQSSDSGTGDDNRPGEGHP